MLPIILIGNNEQTSKYIEDFIKTHRLLPYNIVSLNEKIKISDVRVIQKKLFLKYEKDENRLFVFKNSITYEAQHALLKTLEEIPNGVYIIIVSQNRQEFLPTILSRCQTVFLSLENDKNIEDVEKLKKNLNEFLTSDNSLVGSIIISQRILGLGQKDEILNKLQQALYELILEEVEARGKSRSLDLLITLSHDLLYLSPLVKNNNVNIELALQQCFKMR